MVDYAMSVDVNNFVEKIDFLRWFFDNVKINDTFTLYYKRVKPKCLHCNKSYASGEICPVCLQKLQTDKTVDCIYTDECGIQGNLFLHCENNGNYRRCRIHNIMFIRFADKNFFLI